MNIPTLPNAAVKGKVVFYRADYNVPLQDGKILDDFRIISTFPTLEYLMQQECKIVIGSHLGRPDGEEKPEFSLRPVVERIADQYPDRVVRMAHQIDHPDVHKAIEAMAPGDILVLPNLRFYPGEEANDTRFAQQLADLAEVYVNDAFSVDHRAHASVVGVPALLPGFAGFVLDKELKNLGMLLEKPAHPFVVIMGGAKVSDKIEVIQALAKQADTLLIGGAMANTFLLAKGEDVSKSKAETDKVDVAKQLMKELGDKLVLAADFVKAEVEGGFAYEDIGPAAIKQFQEKLAGAKTIFWNGSLGMAENPTYAVGTESIAKYISGMKNVSSVVAGGDTVETITNLKLHDAFSFVSTGGGAALEFLGGKELPGVLALATKKAEEESAQVEEEETGGEEVAELTEVVPTEEVAEEEVPKPTEEAAEVKEEKKAA